MLEAEADLSISSGDGEGEAEVMDSTPEEVFDSVFNVLLIGDSGVGKTDLIGRLCDEDFTTKFFATIGRLREHLET
jgi:GTPase SAR1 family protein